MIVWCVETPGRVSSFELWSFGSWWCSPALRRLLRQFGNDLCYNVERIGTRVSRAGERLEDSEFLPQRPELNEAIDGVTTHRDGFADASREASRPRLLDGPHLVGTHHDGCSTEARHNGDDAHGLTMIEIRLQVAQTHFVPYWEPLGVTQSRHSMIGIDGEYLCSFTANGASAPRASRVHLNSVAPSTGRRRALQYKPLYSISLMKDIWNHGECNNVGILGRASFVIRLCKCVCTISAKSAIQHT